jgi:autotransporter-associated beta strand protein
MDARNWSPMTVPNGPSDVATFSNSSITTITWSGSIQLSAINFQLAGSAYIIKPVSKPVPTSLTLVGPGITNDSGQVQTFGDLSMMGSSDFTITFEGDATAGSSNTFYIPGAKAAGQPAGGIRFLGQSKAGFSTYIVMRGESSGAPGAQATFVDQSSAYGGDFVVFTPGSDGSLGASILFSDASAAGIATIKGGAVSFADQSTADDAQVSYYDGTVDISGHDEPGITIGALSGTGTVTLGGRNLRVGSAIDLSFIEGEIVDGGKPGGSLTKVGDYDNVYLSGTNTYTGNTTIEGGSLLLDSIEALAGTGSVFVDAGTLTTSSSTRQQRKPVTIGKSVTVGNGTGSGAYLSPNIRPALAIGRTLNFKGDGSYICALSPIKAIAGELIARRVIIDGGQFGFSAPISRSIDIGTAFTVIQNAGSLPISGRFANLPDGGVITAYGNNFAANYEGGDGNDLTLTVVP